MAMKLPLIVLAIGAVVAGYFGVPEGLSGGALPNYIEHLLEPALAHPAAASHGAAEAASHSTEYILTGISVVIAFVGIFGGWVWFNRRPLWQPPSLLENKYYVDEAYDAAIIEPIKTGSTRVLWKIIDVIIIDGAVNGAGFLASKAGGAMRYLQSGFARSYVAVVVMGALLLIGYFVIR